MHLWAWVGVAVFLVAGHAEALEFGPGPVREVDPDPALLAGYGNRAYVASDGDHWLVAMVDDYANTLSVMPVRASGVPVDRWPLEVAPLANSVDIAFDGSNYVLAWSVHDTSEVSSVHFQHLDSSGAVVDTPLEVVSKQSNALGGVGVAGGTSGAIVTWCDANDPNGSGCSFAVVAQSTLTGGVIPSATRLFGVDVATSGDTWLVVGETMDHVIVASRVAGDGSLLDTVPITLDDSPNYPHNPSVQGDDAGWAAVWVDGGNVVGRRVDLQGGVSSQVTLLDSTPSYSKPVIARTNTGWFVAATGSGTLVAGDPVEARALHADLSPDTGIVSIDEGAYSGFGFASTACTGSSTCLVSWRAQQGLSLGRRVNTMGDVLDTVSFPLSIRANVQSVSASDFGFGHWFVTWQDDRWDDGDIFGRFLGGDGTPIGDHAFVVNASGGAQVFPDVARGSDAWLVVWRDSFRVRASRVLDDATVVDSVPLDLGTSLDYGSGPRVASNDGWLVAWIHSDRWCCQGTVVAARIASNGVVVDSVPLSISAAETAKAFTVNVYASGSGYVVSWSDVSGGLFARQVGASGTLGQVQTLLPNTTLLARPVVAESEGCVWSAWAADSVPFDLFFEQLGTASAQRLAGTVSGMALTALRGIAVTAWNDVAQSSVRTAATPCGGSILSQTGLGATSSAADLALSSDGSSRALLTLSTDLAGLPHPNARLVATVLQGTGLPEGGAAGSSGAGGASGTAGASAAGGSSGIAGAEGTAGSNGAAGAAGSVAGGFGGFEAATGGTAGSAVGGAAGTVGIGPSGTGAIGATVGGGGAGEQETAGRGGTIDATGSAGQQEAAGFGGSFADAGSDTDALTSSGRAAGGGCDCQVHSRRSSTGGYLLGFPLLGFGLRRRRIRARLVRTPRV